MGNQCSARTEPDVEGVLLVLERVEVDMRRRDAETCIGDLLERILQDNRCDGAYWICAVFGPVVRNEMELVEVFGQSLLGEEGKRCLDLPT